MVLEFLVQLFAVLFCEICPPVMLCFHFLSLSFSRLFVCSVLFHQCLLVISSVLFIFFLDSLKPGFVVKLFDADFFIACFLIFVFQKSCLPKLTFFFFFFYLSASVSACGS